MSGAKQQYRVNLITDTPAAKDEFGAHQRLADAIAELITTQDGGMSIGLEGGWGSGKSTVINLIHEKFKAKQDHTVILFDAWAHQGDPLRRTFLETVIVRLEELGWINKNAWEKTRAELAQRRKITEQKSIPRLGVLGSLLAFSLLLIPVGLALLNAGLKSPSITPTPVSTIVSTPISSITPPSVSTITSNPLDMVLVGVLLTLIPVVIFLIYFVPQLLRWGWKKAWRIPIAPDDFINFGALIAQKYITDTRTETIENPNPTSVEFEEMFARLMAEAVKGQNRRVILALDNLDRVTSTDALSILAALQTFLKSGDYQQSEWFKKLYILIPYDPDGLKRLWKTQNEDETTRVTTAFLDKTFQIRFEVPPLLLSDWRSYLTGLLKQALPNHDEAEFHAVYRVFALHTRSSFRPTPRDLKLFVNQIGTINRQWKDTFPLAHVAYYVLLRRSSKDVPKGLLDKKIPETAFTDLMGDNIRENLAAMSFNAPVKQALQLLLQSPLEDALGQRNTVRLKELSDNPGFWEVLLDIPFGDWVEKESVKLANAAYCLDHDRLIDKAEAHLRNSIIRSLRKAVDLVETWKPFDVHMAEGMTALLRLLPDESLASQILDRLPAVAEKPEQINDEATVIKSWISGFVSLLNGVQTQNLQQSYANGITIKTSAEGYIELCAQLYWQDNENVFWKFIQPSIEADLISAVLVNAISSEQITAKHVDAIHVLKAGRVVPLWNNIFTVITQQFQAAGTLPPIVVSALMEILWELHDIDAALDNQVTSIVNQGYPLHYLHHVKSDPSASAWCIFMRLLKAPADLQPTPIGNSQDGFTFLTTELFVNPTNYEPLTNGFAELLSYTGKYDLLFQVLDAASVSKAWILECLKKVIANDHILALFTPEVTLARWQFLQAELSEPEFDSLIDMVVRKSTLIEFLCGHDFETGQAGLYLMAAQHGGVQIPDFCNWCQTGLAALDSEEWQSALKSERPVARLLLNLLDNNVDISLGTPYQDALTSHSKEIIASKTKPQQFAAQWQMLLQPLNPTARSFLRAKLLNEALRAEGKIAAEFFDLYGDEIADYETLRDARDTVMNLFIPLLQENNERGLQWVEGIFAAHPDILATAGYAPVQVNTFKTRVQDVINGPEEAISPSISSIAGYLNIHPIQPPSDYQE